MDSQQQNICSLLNNFLITALQFVQSDTVAYFSKHVKLDVYVTIVQSESANLKMFLFRLGSNCC